MKTTLLFPFLLLAATSVASAQTMSATNTGALSTNQLIYSVGEVFVVPTNANQASSGLIGAVSRIEFTSLSIDEIDHGPTRVPVFTRIRRRVRCFLDIAEAARPPQVVRFPSTGGGGGTVRANASKTPKTLPKRPAWTWGPNLPHRANLILL
ncbi:hypothetical protein [Flavobacterium sp. HJ-32-4]|uniref:hypothetical protein n=1 Tax=Flavobacterium sp. HJ-32-4 TaxID=1160795 RepID=UPI001F146DF9|nr:hypothetical protein [Flavobacterium sp. HJ-32-4]UMY65307.1 hypothetical protein MKO97_12455 [Flavobacterium sp. HJ-32-4]